MNSKASRKLRLCHLAPKGVIGRSDRLGKREEVSTTSPPYPEKRGRRQKAREKVWETFPPRPARGSSAGPENLEGKSRRLRRLTPRGSLGDFVTSPRKGIFGDPENRKRENGRFRRSLLFLAAFVR